MAKCPPSVCSSCHTKVSPSLSCGRCGHRIYSEQACSGITPRIASQLINYSGDSLKFEFICSSCKSVLPVNDDSDLKTTIQNLSKTVHDLSVLVSSLIDWRT